MGYQNEQTFGMFDEHKSKRNEEFIIFCMRIDTVYQFRTRIFHCNVSHSEIKIRTERLVTKKQDCYKSSSKNNTYRLNAIFKPSNSKIFLARIGITLFIDGLRKAFAYKVHILVLQKFIFSYTKLI